MFHSFYKQKNKKNKGFTLVEILVAIAVFAMLSTIFTMIYVIISQNQHRAKASQLLLNNSLYALEIIAQDLKNNEIDYNFILPDNDPARPDCSSLNCMVFKRMDGSLAIYSNPDWANNELFYGVYTCDPYPDVCVVENINLVQILSPSLNHVKVDYVHFFVEPVTADPYSSQTVNINPKITIVLKTSYDSQVESEQVSYTLQTTVSSRIYKR
jgi:prepilin-type N-terminal cleavage/methylation domain-containing protein